MFNIKVDLTNTIIEFTLADTILIPEMQQFVNGLREATTSVAGKEIKIKADLRGFKPGTPEVADMIRAVQEFGIKSGVKRVAEIVESQAVALELNKVAQGSGTDKILRRFWEDESAREWLIHGDAR